jgi:peptide deformylase
MEKPKLGLPTPQEFQSGAFRRVITRPEPLLERSAEIDPRDPKTITLARELIRTMQRHGSRSLSAAQLGERVRIIALETFGFVALVNPRIVMRMGGIVAYEHCLSLPQASGRVARAAQVIAIGFQPGSASIVRVTAEGPEARALEHAMDHLEGVLFVERMWELDRKNLA